MPFAINHNTKHTDYDNKMRHELQKIIFIYTLALLEAKKELPLCPSNMQFFPQNLPMHCRMPATISPTSLEAIPLPAPGFSGPIPGPIPGPMPMPMPIAPMPPSSAHKLPVIVMPLYSPDKQSDHFRPRRKKHRSGLKRRPKHYYNSDEDSFATDISSDDSSDRSPEHGWWKRSREGRRSNRYKPKRKRNKKTDILTPVLQYVTKDGYVIFEKQISKGEAKDWLVNKEDNNIQKLKPSKLRDNSNSKELKDDSEDMKFLVKDDENTEVRTEVNPHNKKKNIKRKPHLKHTS